MNAPRIIPDDVLRPQLDGIGPQDLPGSRPMPVRATLTFWRNA